MHTAEQQRSISNVLLAIETIRQGGVIIMTDDEDRENEGDLIAAAELITPEKINFMAKDARGLICLALSPERVNRLQLPMMEDSARNSGGRSTAFTFSIEASSGVTTGISAADRAHTILVASADDVRPQDIEVPGHIFPLRSRKGGVLERAGHTEGSVDLCRLAGLREAAVICEIMNDDGTMARADDLLQVAKTHDLPMVTIADLVNFRLLRETLVETLLKTRIQTRHGEFEASVFRSALDQTLHLAIHKGTDFAENVVDVRVHTQRPLADVFGGRPGSGRTRLDYGLDMLNKNSHGVCIYLCRQNPFDMVGDELIELVPEDLKEEIREQVSGLARSGSIDQRHIGTGAQILRSLGVQKMRVHATNPAPLRGLSGFDLEIVDQIEIKL
jgi:3,4-dihydroxy 2-butanone 4-phosphate synthase / GTP cyclohydrolase II